MKKLFFVFIVMLVITGLFAANYTAKIPKHLIGTQSEQVRPDPNRTYDWYSYAVLGEETHLTWVAPERATFFELVDFCVAGPATIEQVSHLFYEHTSYPWPDATFHFKIYDADGSTLLYESGDLEAENYVEYFYTLTTPLVVDGDFWVAVVPVDPSGHPSSMSTDGHDGHSYTGEPTAWTFYGGQEFITGAYLEGSVSGPQLAVTPDIYDFGNVDVGTTATQTFVLERLCTGDIVLDPAPALVGDAEFTISADNGAPYPTTIPADQTTVEVDVQFAPLTDGTFSTTLEVYDDVTRNTTVINITGYGLLSTDCDWYIIGEDSYGDGWNGGSIDVVIDGTPLYNFTIDDGAGPETFTFGIFDPCTIDLVWNAGSWDEEVTYTLYDDEDNVIFSDGPNPTGTTGIAAECVPPPPEPPINVQVDDEAGIVSWLVPTSPIIEENIDSYTVGDYIAVVSPYFTTWTNSPGSAEDALVSDVVASSGSNSVVVQENQDLILIMDDYTTGVISYDMKMYVPSGYCGYFNLQKTSTPAQEWAFQAYYQTNGEVVIDAGAEAAFTHSFDHDVWNDIKVIVDLDNDWATYYFNGTEIGGYQWTLGTFGDPGLLQFGGVNLFGGANQTQPTDVPMYYFDDVVISEPQDVTGFNVYLDGALDGTVGDDVTEYTYDGLIDLQTYTAGVSAVYAGGESDIVEVVFTFDLQDDFYPPSNPAAVVEDYNDVLVTWEAPSGGGAVEWMRWDSGENGDAIGLTEGGSFYVASHWNPSDLTDYDGAEITKIEFFPNDPGDFVISVWTGPNAGTLVTSEVVASPTVGAFQEVILSSAVTIDASQELWFGYEVTHAVGTYPAGCDAGPAIAGYGDMISFDSVSWDPLSEFGLDYNWNLAAYVEGRDGEAIVISKPRRAEKAVAVSRNLTERNPFSSMPASHVRDSRSLAGYYVYRDGTQIEDTLDPTILSFLDESLDAGTYEYTIEAYYTNPEGISDPTAPVSATVVLDPPINVEASSQPPNIIVTWDAPARGIESYTVYRDGAEIASGVVGLMCIDIQVPTGEYIYNVKAVYEGGYESAMSDDAEVDHVDGDDILKPTVTELTGNYPNPFNPTTKISFSLAEAGQVSINIYNMKGQLVKTLVNAELDNDYHEIVWNGVDDSGKSVSSGVYFYKLSTNNGGGRYTSTKKMILLK